ncbi:MAG: hypothetical protein QOD99_2332 [Chthoniobacter sp.]|jgi:hypothetical protein|nr:hypothetical protein [Chthoniobacter sp.]
MRRRLINVLAAVCLPFALLGLRKPRDPWRRIAELSLAGDEAKFTLAAFGLAVTADTLEDRLRDFLQAENTPLARVTLRGPFLTFDQHPHRFAPPDPGASREASGRVVNFTARSTPNAGLDLWMRVNHAVADGVPMQEMLTRLAENFGRVHQTRFPAEAQVTQTSSSRGVAMATGFYDFQPLLQWRRKLNAALENPLGVGGLLVWQLAQQPEFAGANFAVVADIPEDDTFPRGVDFIVIQPDEFFGLGDCALEAFASEFAKRLARARSRTSRTFRTMKTTALLPAPLARAAMRLNVRARQRTFGTIGISIIKNAEVFLAPIGEFGFERGFIGIGRMDLPAESGGTVGAVSIKGSPELVASYPEALRRALAVQ